ncbi:hypothetical protein MRX96_052760 [Rhipicephalus microplus]
MGKGTREAAAAMPPRLVVGGRVRTANLPRVAHHTRAARRSSRVASMVFRTAWVRAHATAGSVSLSPLPPSPIAEANFVLRAILTFGVGGVIVTLPSFNV